MVLCCSHCKNKVTCCSSLESSFRIGSLHSYITMGVYKDNNGSLFINTGTCTSFMCRTITSCTPPIANEDQNWKLLPKIGDIPRGNFLDVLLNNKQNATTEQWKTVCRKIFSVLITLHPTHLMVDEFKMSITQNSKSLFFNCNIFWQILNGAKSFKTITHIWKFDTAMT